MSRTADAVVIGGGIAGVSIAYHLARGGLKNTVLLEKETLLGMGSSAASAGVIYHHLPEKVNLQLSQKSLERVLEFENELKAKIDFRRNGCIQTGRTPDEVARIRGIVRDLDEMGVEAQILMPNSLREFFPDLEIGDLSAAIYTPGDGCFDPHGMIQGYAAGAKSLGVRFLTHTPATGIAADRGAVCGVSTPEGDISTRIIINAAGPSAAGVARLAGIHNLPIVPCKRQIFISAPTGIVAPDAPFYFDQSPPFYFRPESGGLLLSVAELEEYRGGDLRLDWSSADVLAERATKRLPSLASVQILRGWAGLRSMTPDRTAILGPVPELSGFYLAVGFSGHGVMHAPMTGRILAAMIIDGNLDRCDDIDLRPLAFERFAA